MKVLCVNVGSSSLKAACFSAEEQDHEPVRISSQVVERIGEPGEGPSDHVTAFSEVADAFEHAGHTPDAIAHRLVHGGPILLEHTVVDRSIRAQLDAAVAFAPTHLPAELSVLDAAVARQPAAPQVACFDTAFHRGLLPAARRLPIPGGLDRAGIRRYGFHGLSYEYLVQRLADGLGRRAVLAHLGNGSSLAAVLDGVGIDTTMGLTPTGGLVMGTRTGDLDPGVLLHVMRHHGNDADAIERLVDRESGLLGISERSSDVRDLLDARDAGDQDAAFAIEVYEAVAAKHVAALATVLDGLDTLVFTAGVGEHAAPIRAGIARRLAHLGVAVDDDANNANAAVISRADATVTVRIEPTDEEATMARHAVRLSMSTL